MAARPPIQVTRQREKEAWELRQQFWTEQRIADHLGIERSTVSKMLDRVERDLAERLAEEALPIKARQTAMLERVAEEAFEQWKRSCEDAEVERISTKEVNLVNDEDEGAIAIPAVEVKTTNERKGQSGNPALLEKAMNALADVRKIWGLDAPVKSESNVNQTVKAWVDWPDDSSPSDS
jgi:predicted transcriptional regulator